jgi:hypothetical protein
VRGPPSPLKRKAIFKGEQTLGQLLHLELLCLIRHAQGVALPRSLISTFYQGSLPTSTGKQRARERYDDEGLEAL